MEKLDQIIVDGAWLAWDIAPGQDKTSVWPKYSQTYADSVYTVPLACVYKDASGKIYGTDTRYFERYRGKK